MTLSKIKQGTLNLKKQLLFQNQSLIEREEFLSESLKRELSQVISQILEIILKEIEIINSKIEDSNEEIEICLEEISNFKESVDDCREGISKAGTEQERESLEIDITIYEDLVELFRQKIKIEKKQLVILKDIGKILGIKWVFGKTQLKLAKKEQEIVSESSIDFKMRKLLSIADYLSSSEQEKERLKNQLSGITNSLNLIEQKIEEKEQNLTVHHETEEEQAA